MDVVGLLFLCGSIRFSLSAESCREIIYSNGYSTSGEYNLTNQENKKIEVYCAFYEHVGYTFVSSRTNISFDINKLFTNTSYAVLRHIDINGTQREVQVRQMSLYQDNYTLSFKLDSSDGFITPRSASKYSYIYLGFIPKVISGIRQSVQGYNVGGTDFTFVNCDGTPCSYIAFYFNVYNSTALSNGNANPFSNAWMTEATELNKNDYMDEKFYFPHELHMGGYGALSTTRNTGILGAIGLPFNFNRDEITTKSVETTEITTTTTTKMFTDETKTTTISSSELTTQQHGDCYCPCKENKYSHLKGLNLTLNEWKEIMKNDLRQLENGLKVDKKTSKAYYRTLRSASDDRTTSKSVGYFGILILVLPILSMLISDISRFCVVWKTNN